ncbi:MAG TPA: HDIG domain-containing protein [Aggregatilineales bacterium]|nr:HDIG domain-containing protein [Anaerolineales bacterium]HRE47284.1 HDIG domain-containing protein [Aggregatilineales bacterium]
MGAWNAERRRWRQGIRALSAGLRPVEDTLAQTHLPPPLYTLYRELRRGERQHSLNVLRSLQTSGEAHPALLQAALLHDVGKSRTPFYLWERVIVVLANKAFPVAAHRWGTYHTPTGWRRPFVINVQHAQWGADMVREAGGDPLLVALIAAHPEPGAFRDDLEGATLLAALQKADDTN